MSSINFEADYHRRLPDPVFKGMNRHIVYTRANAVPDGVSLDPNPRDQKLVKQVYKDVIKSLLGQDTDTGTFHLKNRGMTMFASSVEAAGEGILKVMFGPGDGIVDGGHTYEIVTKYRGATADNQWVKLEILTDVPDEYRTDIADGLNSSVQVQEFALANLDHKFDAIKAAISGRPYADKIAWRENQASSTDMDARDIVAIMTLFNIGLYPNGGTDYPIAAYTSKSSTLDRYLTDDSSYTKLLPILPDILDLHDTISMGSREAHNAAGGKGGALAFVEHKPKGFDFIFQGKRSTHRLALGALYPMLGAFRYLVVEDLSTGNYGWRTRDGFDGVKRICSPKLLAEMMRATKSTSDDVGRSPLAIGKSKSHWANLDNLVARWVLEDERTASLRSAT